MPSVGVFKSTDAGGNWRTINNGLLDRFKRWPDPAFVVVDANVPSILYAGTQVGGLFKSFDGGDNWLEINEGLLRDPDVPSSTIIESLAIDPYDSDTLYTSVTSYDLGVTSLGLFKSTDGGGSWSPVRASLPATNVRSIVIDPLNSSTVHIGTNAGVFKSIDRGVSWLPANTGLSNKLVRVVAIDPSTGLLYAGTDGGGIFVSDNGGSSWQ